MILPLSFFLYLFFALLALLLASFFNVVIYRTAKEESFVSGCSYCEHCHQQIAWYDNLPLLSFLLLGGKSRCCGKTIGRNHFWAESIALLYALLFVSVLLQQQLLLVMPAWQLAFYFLFYLTLIFVVIADLRYLLLPDFLIAFLLVLVVTNLVLSFQQGLLPLSAWPNLLAALLFALVFFLTLYVLAKHWLKKEALGWGDIKLMLPLALFLSWPAVLLAIFLSFIIGGFFAMLVLVIGKKKWGQALPFAPFLVLGSLLTSFWGEEIWRWYLTFLL